MLAIYNLGIFIYSILIYLASFFSAKAKLWRTGRKHQTFIRSPGGIWFHFASLGEFEQGRPVLEHFREFYPERKICITFFSPSGYEIRKNTPLADVVYYLPLDTASNARNFISTIQPGMAIFTKYEYWYHFFNETRRSGVPLYVISAIFRPEQIFFKWYGGLHRRILSFVTYFFVQDERSKQLLSGINIDNAVVSGDTRFDRVWANALSPRQIPAVADFAGNSKILVAGSTWPPDEDLIATLAAQYPTWKFIIAPHEINESKINRLLGLLPQNAAIRFSNITSAQSIHDYHILIIDNIGMLSALYQYGDIAYIGGGFGAGIHNTLEAAAFGLPVIFGPNYAKFREARDLIDLKAGFSIQDRSGLNEVIDRLVNDPQFYDDACKQAFNYVKQHTGATGIIATRILQKDDL
ncbi:MAG TPA: glycosyltransferase N-terminal domain-containing protein [Mucilaginibacter sp.]|nr:glycosyltransferase N-terminal domain-containing protein [Mucilaginibacter sp.]